MIFKKMLFPLVFAVALLSGGYVLALHSHVVAQGPAPTVDQKGVPASDADPTTVTTEMASPPDSPETAHVGLEDNTNDPNSLLGVTWRSYRVAGLVFRPRVSSVGYSRSGGCIYHSSGSTAEVFNANLNLPYGSTIQGVRLYYNDTSTLNSTAWVTKYDLYGDIAQEWSVASNGESGSGFTTTYFTDTVDYESYSYVLNWRPVESGSTMQLCGMRVFYTPPPLFGAFLPAVQKP
ncbi:MAG: hypothetical protein D6802_12930 [Ardenticatenia bacterium]|nr:MAG: hypothetical protein D6802_12930 [Ardenticatenia bacterium]